MKKKIRLFKNKGRREIKQYKKRYSIELRILEIYREKWKNDKEGFVTGDGVIKEKDKIIYVKDELDAHSRRYIENTKL